MGMSSGVIESSISGVGENSAFAHASGNTLADKEWEIVKAQVKTADINWLNISTVFTELHNAAKPVREYIQKYYSNAQIESDKIDHYATSMVLADRVGSAAAFGIGFAKEVFDIIGTGFSVADLQADLAGVMGYDIPTALSKGLFVRETPTYPIWLNKADQIKAELPNQFIGYFNRAGGGGYISYTIAMINPQYQVNVFSAGCNTSTGVNVFTPGVYERYGSNNETIVDISWPTFETTLGKYKYKVPSGSHTFTLIGGGASTYYPIELNITAIPV